MDQAGLYSNMGGGDNESGNSSIHDSPKQRLRLDGEVDRFASFSNQKSLVHDRPISQPKRHRPIPVHIMTDQEQQTAPSTRRSSLSSAVPPIPPPPPLTPPTSRNSPPIMPKISESDSDTESEYEEDLVERSNHGVQRNMLRTYKMKLNDRSSAHSMSGYSGHSFSKVSRSSRAPSLCATLSDADSVDSFVLDFDSQHSTGSDSSIECDIDAGGLASSNTATVAGTPATLWKEQHPQHPRFPPRRTGSSSSRRFSNKKQFEQPKPQRKRFAPPRTSSYGSTGENSRQQSLVQRFPPPRTGSNSSSGGSSRRRPLTTKASSMDPERRGSATSFSSSSSSGSISPRSDRSQSSPTFSPYQPSPLLSSTSLHSFLPRSRICCLSKSPPTRPKNGPKRKSSSMEATVASSGSTSAVEESTKINSTSGLTRKKRFLQFLYSGFVLQLLVLFGIIAVVIQSRSQAALAADTLLRLKETESLGLLQLHRLEEHSMHVHRMIQHRLHKKRLVRTGLIEEDSDEDDDDNIESNNPLAAQYLQLSRMSSELKAHAAVKTLQETIQDTASLEIVETYGEGAVKVVIELDFGDQEYPALKNPRNNRKGKRQMAKGNSISIVLWPDAPHAAWTWLEQIQRNIWYGASLQWDASSTLLLVSPSEKDPLDRGHLEFVENHSIEYKSNLDMHHGAWTVGLRETVVDDKTNDPTEENPAKKTKLEMFINLTDNHEERKHETCVGKIMDGFDTLQRLLEATLSTKEGEPHKNVTVKGVTAMHMTHKELEMVFR